MTESSPPGAFVQWLKPVKDVKWFPNPPEGSGVQNFRENVQTTLQAPVSAVMFDLVPPAKPGAEMSFLVAFTDESGQRRGVEFTVSLPPPADKK